MTAASLKMNKRSIGLSRFYSGIHYKHSIQIGLLQGERVAINIFSKRIEPKPTGK